MTIFFIIENFQEIHLDKLLSTAISELFTKCANNTGHVDLVLKFLSRFQVEIYAKFIFVTDHR